MGAISDQNPIPLQRASGLCLVLDTPKGRGVFASHDIPSRTVIEVCPVLVFDPKETQNHISRTLLDNYTYNWPSQHPESGDKCPTQALILGLGSMFNHSTREQNVGWTRNISTECVTYTALRDIKAGEELCISYGHLWFKDVDKDAWEKDEEPVEDGLDRINLT